MGKVTSQDSDLAVKTARMIEGDIKNIFALFVLVDKTK